MTEPIERQVADLILDACRIDVEWGQAHEASIEDGALDGVRDLIREHLTRALIAQAWGVACSFVESFDYEPEGLSDEERIAHYATHSMRFTTWEAAEVVAKLPCPADLAEILWGDK